MDEIKAMLLEEKEILIQEILKAKEDSQSELENGDEIDNSVAGQGRELRLLLQDRERVKLENIEDALKRMESGDYGLCEECDEQISKKRLLVVPFAKLCVSCKQEEEKITSLRGTDESTYSRSLSGADD